MIADMDQLEGSNQTEVEKNPYKIKNFSNAVRGTDN